MQVRIIMFLGTRGYNSLGDLTRSLKEKHVLKYKLIRKHQTWHDLSLSMYRTKFDAKMTKMKQKYKANMIRNVLGTVCQQSRSAGVSNQFAMASSEK